MIFIAGFMLLEYGEMKGRGVMCAEENRRKSLCYTLFSACMEAAFLVFILRLQVNFTYIVT